jgi:hypothetical protein
MVEAMPATLPARIELRITLLSFCMDMVVGDDASFRFGMVELDSLLEIFMPCDVSAVVVRLRKEECESIVACKCVSAKNFQFDSLFDKFFLFQSMSASRVPLLIEDRTKQEKLRWVGIRARGINKSD